jgi:hypothetical protein
MTARRCGLIGEVEAPSNHALRRPDVGKCLAIAEAASFKSGASPEGCRVGECDGRVPVMMRAELRRLVQPETSRTKTWVSLRELSTAPAESIHTATNDISVGCIWMIRKRS